MPTVEYSLLDLMRLLGAEKTTEELAREVPMIGVDLSSVDEKKIVLEVFPNRPDMLSVEGFAAALRGFYGIETGLLSRETKPSGIVFNVEKSVEKVRPAVSSAAVYGVSMSEEAFLSIINIQEKLHTTHGRNRMKVAIGVHDLDKVAPPFTYKAVSPKDASFVPLDMIEEMNLAEILEKHLKGVAYAWTLTGLKKYPLIVDSHNQVLSFPPVINGELTRVTLKTRNLFIESTGWSQLACDQAVNMIAYSITERSGEIKSVDLRA
jgi:phenylalanyl-tRNA synthetase beta chain